MLCYSDLDMSLEDHIPVPLFAYVPDTGALNKMKSACCQLRSFDDYDHDCFIYIYSPIVTFHFFRIDHVIISTINCKLFDLFSKFGFRQKCLAYLM